MQSGNRAFDITPHKYVTSIVTKYSLVYSPFGINLRRVVEAKQAKLAKQK